MTKSQTVMEVNETALWLLEQCVSKCYAQGVLDFISDEVADDVWECSGVQAGECFSDSDVRYAIGRTLIRMFEAM